VDSRTHRTADWTAVGVNLTVRLFVSWLIAVNWLLHPACPVGMIEYEVEWFLATPETEFHK